MKRTVLLFIFVLLLTIGCADLTIQMEQLIEPHLSLCIDDQP